MAPGVHSCLGFLGLLAKPKRGYILMEKREGSEIEKEREREREKEREQEREIHRDTEK